jgi:hypothetical protein
VPRPFIGSLTPTCLSKLNKRMKNNKKDIVALDKVIEGMKNSLLRNMAK